jgi:DHA1 family tetracycline resistance protein-like MFS transporter
LFILLILSASASARLLPCFGIAPSFLLRATVNFVARRKPAIVFIFITLVLDILGIGLIIPILPKLVQEFQHGNVQAAALTVGTLSALYALMQFIFAPMLGSLSDRFGRRRVILVSLLGSGLDYLLLAMAPNLGWFFAGRVIAGITGANIAAASAYIADVSPPEKRAGNFGLIGAAFGIGFIAGPALGGWLGDINLRLPFFVAGGLTLLNWLYGLLILPESLAPENRRAFSWARANPVGSLLSLQRHPIAFGLAGTYFLLNVAHQVFPSTWVLYTSYRYDWSARQVGLSLAIVGLMAGIVQGGLTRFVVRALGERKTAVFGMSIFVMSYIGYGLAREGWVIYAILFLSSIGGVMGPAVQSLISRSVGANEQGGLQGSLTSLTSVAGIIGPPIATGLFARFIGPDAPVHLPGVAFFFSAMLVFCGLLLAVRSFRKGREEGELNR